MSVLLRKAATLARQPFFVLLWLAPTWAMIGLAAAAIRLISLRNLAPVLGTPIGAVALIPLANEKQIHRARQIRLAIAMAAKYAPFRSNCYPQAIVAQVICRIYRIPAAVHFGLRLSRSEPQARELEAHAWVVSGNVAISGNYVSFLEFNVVGCFATSAALPAGLGHEC